MSKEPLYYLVRRDVPAEGFFDVIKFSNKKSLLDYLQVTYPTIEKWKEAKERGVFLIKGKEIDIRVKKQKMIEEFEIGDW